MKIGILTGGGDCPGLNAVIRAVVRKGISMGYEIIGIRNGWKGLLELDTTPLGMGEVSGILSRGGTILGTSRTNPYKSEDGRQKAIDNYKKLNLDALIAVGGEDTLGVANKLHKDKSGINIVGVPKTIDNDLSYTDVTFGFDTAVNIAMEAIDRLHTTAESHQRVLVCEVMGRHAGWITLVAGLAGGADVILIPEVPINVDEVCGYIRKRNERGKRFSIVAIAEGANFGKDDPVPATGEKDAFGHVRLGGIGQRLAEMIEKKTGFETRVTVLGHIQRGGSPTASDRFLGTRFGVRAVELVQEKKFGQMVCLRGTEMESVEIEKAVERLKTVDAKLYEMAKVFMG